jgi:hypothetical protein
MSAAAWATQAPSWPQGLPRGPLQHTPRRGTPRTALPYLRAWRTSTVCWLAEIAGGHRRPPAEGPRAALSVQLSWGPSVRKRLGRVMVRGR